LNTLLHRSPSTDARGWTARPRPRIGRRGAVALVVIALAGGLFVSVPPPHASADSLSDAWAQQKQLQKQIAAQKAKIAALAASQASLSKRIAATRGTLGSVVENLTQVRSDIVAMTVDVAKAQASVDELVGTVAQLDRQLSDLEAEEAAKASELTARRALLADRIRMAYDTDRTSLLETLLSSNDFTDVLAEVGYHLDFADQDKAVADQISQDQEVLSVLHANVELTRQQVTLLSQAAADQKAQLDEELASLRDAKAQLKDLQDQYEQLLAAQQARAEELAANKAEAQALLTKMLKAEKKLSSLIDQLIQEALAKGGLPGDYNGTLQWPMPGVVTQPFGCTGFYLEPPLGSCAHFHRGIDIATAAGTPIRAAGPGEVIFAGKSPYDSTYMVIIAHSSRLVTEYWHVQTHIPVHVGQFVSAGTVIAYEGCTGWCTGPHLHWVVRLQNPNGGTCGGVSCPYVNPKLFVS
jgi:murein DD-endopeptidase MepM/ murein hydrolase activator NlpD